MPKQLGAKNEGRWQWLTHGRKLQDPSPQSLKGLVSIFPRSGLRTLPSKPDVFIELHRLLSTPTYTFSIILITNTVSEV